MDDDLAMPKTLRARWVWADGHWLENARVTIVGNRITVVGNQRVSGEIDLGDQVLLPGLVNAHTHLEFSALREPIPYLGTFASWIRNVVEWRRQESDASPRDAISQGLAESAQAGVTTLGEIATRPWEPQPDSIPRTVVFREALGLQPQALDTQLTTARTHLASSGANGLSPHAPYSLSRELFTALIDLARQTSCPVAMHLAETREELELLASGTGPLADLFTEWGLWHPGQRAAFRSPLEVLQALVDLPRVLVIHGNYLTTEEMAFLAGRENLSVVYCPRTHAYFEHEPYPLAALLAQGTRVALGTDSRASNPDLDLLAEVRHAHRAHPAISPGHWIEMATRHGAEALGLGQITGRIAPGMRAEFFSLPIPTGINDPFEVFLSSDP